MTILETKGLTKRFGNLTAVNELTISTEASSDLRGKWGPAIPKMSWPSWRTK
jgi:ABC-type branched-subunit amino acid transport system ATPase component